MTVKLKTKKILDSLSSEDSLLDSSAMDAIYDIRTLKGLIESNLRGFIDVSEPDENGQVFSDKYNIWYQRDQYDG